MLDPDPPAADPIHPRALAMGEACHAIRAEKGVVLDTDLLDEGFTRAEMVEHGSAARRYADARWLRDLLSARDDRQARLAQALRLCNGLLPEARRIHLQLRQAGFSNAEIADLWGDLIAGMQTALNRAIAPAKVEARA